jgi:hypothetical protein
MSKMFTYPHQPIQWGGSPHDFTTVGTEHNLQLGPYTTELIQRYIYGTRYLMWDGRVFKYSKSLSATVNTYRVCGAADNTIDAWSTAVATVAGNRWIDIALTGRVEDDCAGGYVQIYDSTITHSTMRGIVGNDASGATNTRMYLDYPIAHTVTVSDYTEVWASPYAAIYGGDNYICYLGVAAVPVTATLTNFWLQTWGPCIISGGGAALQVDATNNKDVVADSGGSLHEISTHENYQRVGQMISGGSSTDAGPLIMLMLSV